MKVIHNFFPGILPRAPCWGDVTSRRWTLSGSGETPVSLCPIPAPTPGVTPPLTSFVGCWLALGLAPGLALVPLF